MAIARLIEEVKETARRAGREADRVRIVGVTKKHPVEACRAAFEAGLRDLGENYLQEWIEKCDATADLPIRWHLVGRLQRRKAKEVARRAGRLALFHALDDLRVAEELAKRLDREGARLSVLVQVHATDEPEKGGVAPGALDRFLRSLRPLEPLEVRGLMTMGPVEALDDAEASRSAFRLTARLAAEHLPPGAELSMGMSGDWKVAIEEGATILRIGTALFGPRQG